MYPNITTSRNSTEDPGFSEDLAVWPQFVSGFVNFLRHSIYIQIKKKEKEGKKEKKKH